MIKLKNISVVKGQKQILKDVSFCLKPGQISVVLGTNGAGKSTLLETLSANNKLSAGSIQWEGEDLNELKLNKLAQKRAVLSQSLHVNFPIEIAELVEMGAYANPDLSAKENERLVIQALQTVDMLDFIHRDYNTLSGGEQKRIQLAKCIVQLQSGANSNTNQYLLLDEPTASLDIRQQYKLLEIVKTIVKKQKIGVFAILHDINLAAQFADEILLMKSGEILFQGTPQTTLTNQHLKTILNIDVLVQQHPVYDCPYIFTLQPEYNHFQNNKTLIYASAK